MELQVRPPRELAGVVAARIATEVEAAVAARGRAVLALSGGSTPVPMYAALAATPLPWDRVDVVQVDERIAPDGDPARNVGAIHRALVAAGPLAATQLHPMDVTAADPEVAAEDYEGLLAGVAGDPPVLDVVHLGLGRDGHTASLVPGDPVLEVVDRRVAVTGSYEGHRRMTLTFPVLDAARSRIWMVDGGEKADALAGLLDGDHALPAGRVEPRASVLFTTPGTSGGRRRSVSG